MTRVLKGETLGPAQLLIPLFVCVVLTVGCIAYVARMLRSAAVK